MFCLTPSIAHRQHYKTILLCLWCIGFAFGCYISSCIPEYLFLLMRTSLTERVSIVWLLVANFFPVILVGLAVLFKSAFVASIFTFTKAFVYGFSLLCIRAAFSSASWLVFLILFVPAFLDGVIWLSFVLRNRGWKKGETIYDLLFSLVSLIALNVLDYFTVSPFIAELLY